jgi:MFS family permease
MTVPVLIGAVGLGLGFVLAAMPAASSASRSCHGLLLGLLGSSATFAPLVADTSLWFVRRRGIAVAVCASGNYVAGAIWPPIVQHFVEHRGLARHLHDAGPRLRAWPWRWPWLMRSGPPRRWRPRGGVHRRSPPTRALRPLDEPGAGAAVRGRRGLLRGDVDAAGAHRRLLRRPRLRRRARRARCCR